MSETDPYDYLDDEDDEPEEIGFECAAYWVEGKSEGAGYWHCPIAGTEDCDWECPGWPGDDDQTLSTRESAEGRKVKMNPFDLTIPVEELAAYCALTEREIKSLRECPASSISFPQGVTRTAYVCERLPGMGLVTSLWCKEDGEVFFTWQRTAPGDRLLQYLDVFGSPTNPTER